MSILALRDYQQEALIAVLENLKAGVTAQLIVLPTGAGKTIIMAAIAQHLNKKTLILAHREELIQQAYEKIKLFWPEADIGIVKAQRNEFDHQIVIGSVQSCSQKKRLSQLKEQGFEVLMVDEAHHATADSYRKIIDRLGFSHSKKRLLIGVTATPNRSDNHGLGDIFKTTVYSRSISTMIKAGYLSPVIGRKIITACDLRGIKIRHGDFESSSLSFAVDTPERNEFVASKYLEHAVSRKSIAFCASVRHCKNIAAALNAKGIISLPVFGAMPAEERAQALSKFKNNEVQVLTSVGVLTEGYDESSVDCIAMCKPTKSTGLYIQQIGRGLRLSPSKKDCLVLDFADNIHNINNNVVSLRQTIPSEMIIDSTDEETSNTKEISHEQLQPTPIFQVADEEFDILNTQHLIWVPLGDNEFSLSADDNIHEIVIRPKNNGYVADLYRNNRVFEQIVHAPISLDYCSGVCEDFARKYLVIKFAETNGSWLKRSRNIQPSEKQLRYLRENGFEKAGITLTDAAFEIRKIVAMKKKEQRLRNEPATDKQRAFLKGVGVDPENLSRTQAMRAISTYKQMEMDII